jgi:hypothetical protein
MLIIFLIILAVILVIVLVVAVIGLMHRRQRGRTLSNSTRYNDPSVTNRENQPDQRTGSISDGTRGRDTMRTSKRE